MSALELPKVNVSRVEEHYELGNVLGRHAARLRRAPLTVQRRLLDRRQGDRAHGRAAVGGENSRQGQHGRERYGE